MILPSLHRSYIHKLSKFVIKLYVKHLILIYTLVAKGLSHVTGVVGNTNSTTLCDSGRERGYSVHSVLWLIGLSPQVQRLCAFGAGGGNLSSFSSRSRNPLSLRTSLSPINMWICDNLHILPKFPLTIQNVYFKTLHYNFFR
jgi:hypothetical protein